MGAREIQKGAEVLDRETEMRHMYAQKDVCCVVHLF